MTPQSLQARLSNIRPHLDLNANEAKVLATLMHGKESMFKSVEMVRNALSGLEWKLYQGVGRLPKWDADALDTFIRLGEHSLRASGIANPIANAYEGGDKVRLNTSYRSGKGVQVDGGDDWDSDVPPEEGEGAGDILRAANSCGAAGRLGAMVGEER